MKIIIKGASFKDNNLESTTISKYYSVTYSGDGVSSSSSPRTIAYGEDGYATQDLVATIKVLSSYTFNSVTSVSVGGKALVSGTDYTVNNNVVTIPANKINGNVVIVVATEKVNTGGDKDEPGTSRLPNEYQEVEYLKTNESQYFVLGEVSSNVIYEIKFRSNEIDSPDGLIGCYSSTAEANRSQIRISYQKNTSGRAYKGIEFMYGGEGSVEKNNVETTQITLDYWTQPNILKVDANKLYWNGELKVTRTAFTSNALGTPLTLFAQNNNNAGTSSPGFARHAAVECYYVKIQDSSKSINKELIPCYRKSDNAIGFYDIIGGAFITPTSGTIIEKGPNV